MRIAIFHYNPIEKFPPVMNLLRVLEKKMPQHARVVVFTTKAAATVELFLPNNNRVIIRRLGVNAIHLSVLWRYLAYIRYFSGAFLQCLFLAPDRIFYYESMSSLVPVLLKKYVFRKARLLIHYHEYMSVQEYRQMFLSDVFHRLEKKIYAKAAWVSQTNAERLAFFLQDIGMPALGTAHVVPNYPLRGWIVSRTNEPAQPPVRLVYVGSFGSMETIYVKETLEWVQLLNGEITLDIYSFNIPGSIMTYIKELNCKHIRVLEEVGYYHLPEILKNYHAGLILYKGLSKNFEYNAPNKLFEYLACGLDVWYPQTLKGIWQYDTLHTSPRICRLNFEALDCYSVKELVTRWPATKDIRNFYFEEAAAGLIDTLVD